MAFIRIAAVATLLASASAVFAQGAPDPAEMAAVDAAYGKACATRVSPELCGCVIGVASVHLATPAERQVFYEYMMGEVSQAKARRATFSPEQASAFNVALQKADVMLRDRCDAIKQKDAAARPVESPKAP
ncbi:hypothetical protein GCM10008171_21760 [Methylopila jiangsuensis]|uniref:Uncharacterized protein n=1 Tax=Methylopila jiangsuensis TaxID=586230 RepID=A0A9W6JGQ8_9HYPH|nr:hypothetical protein [Methylopila jiangsuensis]MDR6286732.1 hypothetical protein [Methylopila jiangsuensis]GLK76922.1 hypothetical protein GCM10008171_21760 [Methylopila jiangsuensis]